MHIPKTAGSTFNTCLENQYRGRRLFVFTGGFDQDVQRFNGLSAEQRSKVVLFLGHAPIATGIEEIDSVPIITFLRDPVARVQSFIQHVAEGKAPEYLSGPFDLDRFLASGFIDLANLQTRGLVTTGYFRSAEPLQSMSASAARDAALDNLFNRVSVFGLQEYFDQSLILFARHLDWSIPFYTNSNRKNASRLLEFKQHHIDRIAELNAIDIEVYNAAKSRFLSQIQPPDFPGEQLERLVRLNSAGSARKCVWYALHRLNRLRRRARRFLGDRSEG